MKKRIDKPWGYEELIELNEHYAVKFLFMKKGHQCSLQHHEFKTETVLILEGELEVFYNNKWSTYKKNDFLTILPGEIHRMKAVNFDCLYMECSTNELEDVVRHQDDFNRN